MLYDKSIKKSYPIQKIKNFYVSSSNSLIDYFGKKIASSYDFHDTFVISGSPRGGTTWLAESISSHLGYLMLWEPLEESAHSGIRSYLNIKDADPYIEANRTLCPEDSDYIIESYLFDVISGKKPLSKYLRKKTYHLPVSDLLKFNRYIVKFVRGNLLLHWLLNRFNLKGILLIRHPCAVVASQMHFAWKNALQWKRRWISFFDHYPNNPLNNKKEKIFSIIENISTTEEVLALDWAVTNLIPLYQPKPHPWLLVSYEEILSNRDTEWRRIANYFSIPVPPQISKISSTYKRKKQSENPYVGLDKWQKNLNNKQIDRVLTICSELGATFYTTETMPISLENFK